MRHDLADGEDEVVSAGGEEVGDLGGPRKIGGAFGDLLDERRRDGADGGDAGAPVVHAEEALRHAGVHLVDLGNCEARDLAVFG